MLKKEKKTIYYSLLGPFTFIKKLREKNQVSDEFCTFSCDTSARFRQFLFFFYIRTL